MADVELLVDTLDSETEDRQVKDHLRDVTERELEESLSDPRDADGALMFND